MKEKLEAIKKQLEKQQAYWQWRKQQRQALEQAIERLLKSSSQ